MAVEPAEEDSQAAVVAVAGLGRPAARSPAPGFKFLGCDVHWGITIELARHGVEICESCDDGSVGAIERHKVELELPQGICPSGWDVLGFGSV
ncbi:hypothetical protein AZF07_07460 [Corynebacterium diphtheriae subsp. lausannense]|nr:hypothetical protein AZF07_07460 [Corynebacterium diphtheriae subsp. lausannense]